MYGRWNCHIHMSDLRDVTKDAQRLGSGSRLNVYIARLSQDLFLWTNIPPEYEVRGGVEIYFMDGPQVEQGNADMQVNDLEIQRERVESERER